MNMTKTDDPFKRLQNEAGNALASTAKAVTADSVQIMPVPSTAPPPMRKHRNHPNEAAAIWTYKNAAGAVLGCVARFNKPDGGKDVIPQTWRRDAKGEGWRWKGFDDPRPLYGLDRLAARPEAPVLLVEGEKTADAAAALFPGFIAMCWHGGTNATGKADWAPLAGRKIVILPDADEPGLKAAKAVRGALVKLGVKAAAIMYLPEGLPKGWDCADSFPSTFTIADLSKLIDQALAPPAEGVTAPDSEGWPAGFTMNGGGLWFQPKDQDAKPVWVCGPFDVLGEARDAEGLGWSVVIRFKDRDGKEKTAILGKGKLANGWSDLRRDLADMGLSLLPRSPNAFDPLPVCLLKMRSERRIMLCGATGWAGPSFVLPSEVLSPPDAEPVMFTGEAKALHFGQTGDLASWQRDVAGRAVGNTRAIFCLSLAFAGPLLKVLNLESGGFHIRGKSSSGKSTLAMIAGSVWGGGGSLGFSQAWRATANGLETIATGHSDAFLALDELGQLAPEEAGNAAYMLSNGQAKARLKADGTARARSNWRAMFLSTGEISLGDHIKAAKAGGQVMAGQEVRVIDLVADAGQGLGAWEDTHEFATGAEYSDAMKGAAKRHYGHAGPMFVRGLIDGGDDLLKRIKAVEARFLDMAMKQGGTGQVHRAASRFALVAAAGEAAAWMGVVPWAADTAFGASTYLFKQWVRGFGRHALREETAVLKRITAMIESNLSRFGSAGDDDWEVDAKSPRAGEARALTTLGVFSKHAGEDYFMIHRAGWNEIFKGMDSAAAASFLKAKGYLETEDGKCTKRKKVKGQLIVMYFVKSSILSHDFDDAE